MELLLDRVSRRFLGILPVEGVSHPVVPLKDKERRCYYHNITHLSRYVMEERRASNRAVKEAEVAGPCGIAAYRI